MNVPKLASAVLPVLGALALLPGAAAAQQHAQRYIDETELNCDLHSIPGRDDAGAYYVRLWGTVYNSIGAADAIRVDVKQGSRTLTSKRCEFGGNRDDDGGAGRLNCEIDGAELTATGNVTIDLVYVDDQDSSTTLIRSLKVKVNRYWSWEGMDGNRPRHRAQYQIAGDDLLGVAYGYHISQNVESNQGRQQVSFYFWTSSGRWHGRRVDANLNNASMRCTVDGTRLHDLQVGTQTSGSSFEVDNRVFTRQAPQDDDVQHWDWNRVVLRAYGMYWGLHPDVVAHNNNTEVDANRDLVLGDHPGNWSCDLRSSGRVVRQFRFVVGADGRIVQHAELQGAGAIHVVPGVVMLDTRFGTPNDFDFVFNPAAIRASAPFGRPWTHPEAVREMLGALPPAVGSSDPGVQPAGGGGRHH